MTTAEKTKAAKKTKAAPSAEAASPAPASTKAPEESSRSSNLSPGACTFPAAEPANHPAPPPFSKSSAELAEVESPEAEPPEAESQAVETSAAKTPKAIAPAVKTSAAGLTSPKRPAAGPPAGESTAKRAAVEPPVKSTAAEPPAKSTAAEPPAKSTAAEPPAKSTAAEPPAKPTGTLRQPGNSSPLLKQTLKGTFVVQVNELYGKLVAITGAASGIGRKTAILLAKLGVDLSLSDLDGIKIEKLDKELCTLRQTSNVKFKHACMRVDVRDRDRVDHWIKLTVQVFGRPLDGAANLECITGEEATVRLFDPENYADVFAFNVEGLFNCMSAELIHMRRSDPKKGIPGGSIVNLATAHGVSAYPEAAVYCASKHAVVGITKCASREEAKFGIRVNAIAPAFVSAVFKESVGENIQYEQDDDYDLGDEFFEDRFAQPREVANVVHFLLSPHSGYVTGSVYEVSGGYRI